MDILELSDNSKSYNLNKRQLHNLLLSMLSSKPAEKRRYMKIIQAIFGEDENPIKMDGRFFFYWCFLFLFLSLLFLLLLLHLISLNVSLSLFFFIFCCCWFVFFFSSSLSFSLVPSLSILILLFFFQTQKMLVSDWWKKARTGEFRYICQRWNVY